MCGYRTYSFALMYRLVWNKSDLTPFNLTPFNLDQIYPTTPFIQEWEMGDLTLNSSKFL